jgi:hypothetical protein
MSDEIRRLDAFETDADEAWERLTDEPDIRCVEVASSAENGGWLVSAAVAELLSDADPLEGTLHQRMLSALGAVGGVEAVQKLDLDVWLVRGSASGRALTEAAAQVVDGLADGFRQSLNF